jgi:hypothetical protein
MQFPPDIFFCLDLIFFKEVFVVENSTSIQKLHKYTSLPVL